MKRLALSALLGLAISGGASAATALPLLGALPIASGSTSNPLAILGTLPIPTSGLGGVSGLLTPLGGGLPGLLSTLTGALGGGLPLSSGLPGLSALPLSPTALTALLPVSGGSGAASSLTGGASAVTGLLTSLPTALAGLTTGTATLLVPALPTSLNGIPGLGSVVGLLPGYATSATGAFNLSLPIPGLSTIPFVPTLLPSLLSSFPVFENILLSSLTNPTSLMPGADFVTLLPTLLSAGTQTVPGLLVGGPNILAGVVGLNLPSLPATGM